jgi:hypothetical protein
VGIIIRPIAHKKGFRGQSKEYAAITPSLFRLSEPIDLQPLLKAADNLWLEAHGVNEEMRRIREMDYRYYGSLGASHAEDEFEGGLFEQIKAWFARWIFTPIELELDGYPFNIPVGSGMGTTESYSKVFSKYYGRVPNERLCICVASALWRAVRGHRCVVRPSRSALVRLPRLKSWPRPSLLQPQRKSRGCVCDGGSRSEYDRHPRRR